MQSEILQKQGVMVWMPMNELDEPLNLKGAFENFKNSGLSTILLDLTGKEWLSSAEIGVVMWIYKELDALGSRLCLVTNSQFVMKTVQLTGVDQLIPVFESRQDALGELTIKE